MHNCVYSDTINLQGSYLSQSDFKNEEVLEVTAFFLEIRGATQSIKAIVEVIVVF